MGMIYYPNSQAPAGLQVPPGDPGIDTNAPGALVLGETNATSIDIDPPLITGAGGLLTLNLGSGGSLQLSNFASLLYLFDASGHIISQVAGVPVSSALGAGVTSANASGNDVRGTITIVMSAGLAANTRVATFTFAATYGATPPKVALIDQTSAVGLTVVNSYVLAQSTGVSFDIAFDQALVAGTYIIDYIVIG
jgi:hypothetical protein